MSMEEGGENTASKDEEKDAAVAAKDAEIEQLKAQLAER